MKERENTITLKNDVTYEIVKTEDIADEIAKSKYYDKDVYSKLIESIRNMYKFECIRLAVPANKKVANLSSSIRNRLKKEEIPVKISTLGNILIIRKL